MSTRQLPPGMRPLVVCARELREHGGHPLHGRCRTMTVGVGPEFDPKRTHVFCDVHARAVVFFPVGQLGFGQVTDEDLVDQRRRAC